MGCKVLPQCLTKMRLNLPLYVEKIDQATQNFSIAQQRDPKIFSRSAQSNGQTTALNLLDVMIPTALLCGDAV